MKQKPLNFENVPADVRKLKRYNPNIHHRQSYRLRGYNYARDGSYFITICCHNKICRFGKVVNGVMILNEFGQIAHNEWVNLSNRFSNFVLDTFQIMPDHMHGIITLRENREGARLALAPNTKNPSPPNNTNPRQNEFFDDIHGPPDDIHGPPDDTDGPSDFDDGQPQGIAPTRADGTDGPPDDTHGFHHFHDGPPDFNDGQPQGIAPTRADGTDGPPDDTHGFHDFHDGPPGFHDGPPGFHDGQPQGIAPSYTPAVSDIVGAYKSLVANGCLKIYKSRNETMGKLWQRNYYERIIWNERFYQNAKAYIINNPIQWTGDTFHTI